MGSIDFMMDLDFLDDDWLKNIYSGDHDFQFDNML